MRNAETVLGVMRERGRRLRPLEDMYRQLSNPALSLRAYGRLSRNAGAVPAIAWRCSKNCTIVKPKPISDTDVRTHDISVRSTLKRVRSHPK